MSETVTCEQVSKHKDGQVYKIICNSDPNWCYVGSTTLTLHIRWLIHKSDYRRWKNNPQSKKYIWFEHVGDRNLEEYHIVLIEWLEQVSKHELEHREGYWITELKACNRVVAGRTQAEYRILFREKILKKKKEYREKNKEKLKEYQERTKEQLKEYREKNKEEIKKRKKEYIEKNKEQIKKKNKNYREKNKETLREKEKKYKENRKEITKQKNKEYRNENDTKLKEKFDCGCGGRYTYQHRSTHEKTKRHLEFIRKQTT